MYIDSTISHKRRYDIDDPFLEMVAIKITPHTVSLIVICWYRPPTSENDNERFLALRKLLSAVDAESKEIILRGVTPANQVNCD